MTKILYIPTGEYLKFYNRTDGAFPTEVLVEKFRGINTTAQKEIALLLLRHNWNYTTEWLEVNNVIVPILPLELKIIHD